MNNKFCNFIGSYQWCSKGFDGMPDITKPLSQDGDVALAEELFKIGTDHYLHNRMNEALESYTKALKHNCYHIELQNNYGVLLKKINKFDKAHKSYRNVMVLKPNHRLIYYNSGLLMQEMDETERAIAFYKKAIRIESSSGEACNNLGLILQNRSEWSQAINFYKMSVVNNPVSSAAWNNLGNAGDQIKEAITCYRHALILNPKLGQTHHNFAIYLEKKTFLNQAIDHYRQAAQLIPMKADIFLHLGHALSLVGAESEASDYTIKAIILNPSSEENYNILALISMNRGDIDKALKGARRGLVIKYDDPESHTNLAILLLSLGQFHEGWAEYEWRHKTSQLYEPREILMTKPLWRHERGHQKTVFIHGEQGLGDHIQFCRYIPLIHELGWKVLLEVPDSLVDLMKSLKGVYRIIPKGQSIPHFDCHLSMMSLPFVFQTDHKNIPSSQSYLSVNPSQMNYWKKKLPQSKKILKIGLAWAGDSRKGFPHLEAIDKRRSINPELLEILFSIPNVCFVSLQKTEPFVPKNFPLLDFMKEINNFSETAALISNLDLIISVDTAIVHLAGALGKKTFLMNRYDSCWRWLITEKESAWYPSLTIFRQKKVREWTPVINDIYHAITTFLAPKKIKLSEKNPSKKNDDFENIFLEAAELNLSKRYLDSNKICQKLIIDNPHSHSVLHLIGVNFCLMQDKNRGTLLISYAILLAPDIADYHSNLYFNCLYDKGDITKAIESAYQAAIFSPLRSDNYTNLGLAYQKLDQQSLAEKNFLKAIILSPESETFYYNLSNVAQYDNQFALNLCHYGVKIASDNPLINNNLGLFLERAGYINESITVLRKSLNLKPDLIEAHINLGISLLKSGKLTEGWSHYEWRFQLGSQKWFTLNVPQWQGEYGHGKTLLIHAEQGYGDTLQFCRLIPLVAQKNWRIILAAPQPLHRLLQTLSSIDLIVEPGIVKEHYDYHCPLLSLPLALKLELTDIPNQVPYFSISRDTVTSWKNKVSPYKNGQLSVGLAWAGNPQHEKNKARSIVDMRRSIDFPLLTPLFSIPHVTFFSLQKIAPEIPSDYPLINFMEDINDFYDCAALILNLDIIITVDTAIVHLAGALGKQVWMMDRFDSCWRWLNNRKDSPWYPSLTIYRQKNEGDWSFVIQNLKKDLQQLLTPKTNDYDKNDKKLLLSIDEKTSYLKNTFSQIIDAPHRHQPYNDLSIFYNYCFKLFDAQKQMQRALLIDYRYHDLDMDNYFDSLLQIGDMTLVSETLQKLVDTRPTSAKIHCHAAFVTQACHRPDLTFLHLRGALILEPAHSLALLRLGHISDDLLEKKNKLWRALVASPDKAEYRYPTFQLDNDSNHLKFSIILEPHLHQGYFYYAMLASHQKNFEKTENYYLRSILLSPFEVNARINWGTFLEQYGYRQKAQRLYQESLVIQPNSYQGLSNYGNVLQADKKLFEGVIKSFRATLIEPKSGRAQVNLGAAYHLIRDYKKAEICYRTALNLDPTLYDTPLYLSFSLLAQGRLLEGWIEHEKRWESDQLKSFKSPHPYPYFRGEKGKGRHLLVFAEQGFGDSLQFCRYIPMVAKLGWKISLHIPQPLMRLFKSLKGVEALYSFNQPLPDFFDAQCSMMSLPAIFKTELTTIPHQIPYLKIKDESLSHWKKRLNHKKNNHLSVGLVWEGNKGLGVVKNEVTNLRRSISPDFLSPLFALKNIIFYNFQKDKSYSSAQFIEKNGLLDFIDDCPDFYETAAYLSQMDLLITVDTAMAHLSGALGLETWVLNRYDSCWRWLENRSDSPWYPSLRLFNQTKPGDWAEVIERVSSALKLKNITEDEALALAEDFYTQGAENYTKAIYEKAQDYFKKTLILNPLHLLANSYLSVCYQISKCYNKALIKYQQTLRLDDQIYEAHSNMSIINNILLDYNKAIDCDLCALIIKPDWVSSYLNLGYAHLSCNDLEQAEWNALRAVLIDPHQAYAHYNLALILLTRGRFREGWIEHEWRHKIDSRFMTDRYSHKPQWAGRKAISPSNKLLIHAEQGHGDSLQFYRYAPLIKNLGWKITLESQPLLARLFNLQSSIENVTVASATIPDFDEQTAIMSLPLSCYDFHPSIPNQIPYIVIDQDDDLLWKKYFSHKDQKILKVGLAWAGNPRLEQPDISAIDKRRSISFDHLRPLLTCKSVEFYSLQKTPPFAPPDVPIIDFMPMFQDFLDSAALINNLDLVISVDSAVLHLSAALGIETWLLDRKDSCWRWLRGKETSDWYPSLTIIRQEEAGDWSHVIQRAKGALLEKSRQTKRKKSKNTRLDYTLLPVKKESSFILKADSLEKFDLKSEAQQTYKIALIANPYAQPLYQKYKSFLYRHKKFEEAIVNCQRECLISGTFPTAMAEIGLDLQKNDLNDLALIAYQTTLRLDHHYAEVYANMGVIYRKKQKYESSIYCYDRAIILKPHHPTAYYNKALVLQDMDRFEESMTLNLLAIRLHPRYGEAHNNLGNLYLSKGDMVECEKAYSCAIDCDPHSAIAHTNYAMTLLKRGDFSKGWQEYEWRRLYLGQEGSEWDFKGTAWQGDVGLGRTMLIHGEQGNGDIIQFCRYVPMVAEMGWTIILYVPLHLTRLCKTLPLIDRVIAYGDSLPYYDTVCPLLSLPYFFKTTLTSIPHTIPYLSADSQQQQDWHNRLSPFRKEKKIIGLAWAGDARPSMTWLNQIDRRRSIDPKILSPLLTQKNLTFVSLQKTGPKAPASFGLIDVMNEMNDFADSAAFITNLDLVITVDTAIVHLASALGKPTWLLDRYDSCWRWMNRQDSPWYPQLKIFRQSRSGDWNSVIITLKEELLKRYPPD